MRARTSARTALVAGLAALVLGLTGTSAAAHDTDGRPARHGLPTSYLLDPVGPAADDVFPEGIAAARRHLLRRQHDRRHDLPRRRSTRPVARPFLPGRQPTAARRRRDGDRQADAVRRRRRHRAACSRTTCAPVRSSARGRSPTPTDPRPTFLNDIAVTPRGDVYVTDSLRPVLYRIGAHDRRTHGVEELPSRSTSPAPPCSTRRVQPRTGSWRRPRRPVPGRRAVQHRGAVPDLAPRPVGPQWTSAVSWSPATASSWPGGRCGRSSGRATSLLVTIALDRRLASGTVVGRTTDPSFDDPTTAALVGRSLLVVNSQFGERGAGEEPGPFTVSRVRAP